MHTDAAYRQAVPSVMSRVTTVTARPQALAYLHNIAVAAN